MIKNFLKSRLPRTQYKRIKSIGLYFISIPFVFNLTRLAIIYKSDKGTKHSYTKHYQSYFRNYKFRKIKLFEIGVGGYHYSDQGGNSLRLWKRYFPFGRIYSLDIYDKSFFEESRIKIFKGSQTDKGVLDKIIDEIGAPDFIIDDGSHINNHVIESFMHLFPKLREGGIYVIEDVSTSYWPDYGGDSENLSNPKTIMNFFKSLTDSLNFQEYLIKDYQPGYYDKHVVSIQFYHNLIFIFKGINDEPSNIDWNNLESVMTDKLYTDSV